MAPAEASPAMDVLNRDPVTGEILMPGKGLPAAETTDVYGTSHKKAVKLGPNKVTEPTPNPESYSSQSKPAVNLGANKVEEPAPNPEGYGTKLETAKQIKARLQKK